MILACPSCQARYLVPTSHFAAGPRPVRCARCGHMWTADTPREPAADLAQQLAALTPVDEPAAPVAVPVIQASLPVVQKPGGFWHNDWFLAGLVLLLAAFLLGCLLARTQIAHIWPSTEAIYDSIGLHIYHVGEGLSLREVRSEMRFEGATQLAVEGQIHNDTDKLQALPPILAAAIGPDGKTMQSWQIEPPAATVAPGENVAFTSSIRAPQGNVTEINLHFVEPNNNGTE